MMNLVTIQPLVLGAEAFVVKTPSEYIGNTATIVDSARSTNGYMIGTVIRNGVAKIQLKWNFITAEEWAEMLMQFEPEYGGAFVRSVTFFNQTTGRMETREMYVSDRTSAGSFLLHNQETTNDPDKIGLPRGYLNASLSLIEI